MSPIILVGAGILLFGLGLGLGYWVSRSREATKASDIQHELDDYRRNVTEHFSATAEHFQALGEQYKSLYKHMAHGAEALCDPKHTDARLEFPTAATAALTADADEIEAVPEPIKDYAPEEESEPAPVEVIAEEANVPEPVEEISVAEETPAEPKAQDELADPISQPTPEETERTVH